MMTAGTIKSLTDGQLATLAAGADDELMALLVAECDRRDRAERRARADAAIREEYRLMVHADYLAAEAETNGYLLSREGRARGLDPIRLWGMREDQAMRLASEELRTFWERRPRLTMTAWRRMNRRPEPERITHCAECGFPFGRPQMRATCRHPEACDKRQAHNLAQAS
jgi:hypothetical protein